MRTKGKSWTLLVALGFFASLLAATAPAGADGGRQAIFGVTATFAQSGVATTFYDVNAGGNLTIDLSVTNTGNNTTTATVVLGFHDDLEGFYEGVLKTWTPQTLGNDSPTALSFTLEPFLLEYLFIYPMFSPMFWVNITDENATPINQSFPIESRMAMAVINHVAVTTSNAQNNSVLVLGLDELEVGVNVTGIALGKDLTGGVLDFYLDDSSTGKLGSVDLDTMANNTTKVYTFKTNLSGVTPPPTFDPHTIVAVATVGTMIQEESSGEFLVAEPMAQVALDSLTADIASAFEGAAVNLTARLNNTGTADAGDLVVNFYDGTSLIGNLTNISVAMGATKDVTFKWTLPDVAQNTNKTLKAMFGASEAMVNLTVLAKLPKIELLTFTVPAKLTLGDKVDLTATLMNNGTGDAMGVMVEFYDGTTKLGNSTAFDLVAGNTTTVTVKVTIAGTADVNHTFFVKAMGAEKNVTRMVAHVPVPAKVAISSFSVKPTKKDKQPQDSTQSYTLTIVLKNTGELRSVNCTLTIKEGSKAVVTEALGIDPGQNLTKTYTWKVKGSGSHTATATLTGAEAVAPTTMTTKCTLEYTPGFEVLFLAAAIFVAAILARRRKN